MGPEALECAFGDMGVHMISRAQSLFDDSPVYRFLARSHGALLPRSEGLFHHPKNVWESGSTGKSTKFGHPYLQCQCLFFVFWRKVALWWVGYWWAESIAVDIIQT